MLKDQKTTAIQPNNAINGIFLSRTQEAEMDISVETTKIPVPHKIPKNDYEKSIRSLIPEFVF